MDYKLWNRRCIPFFKEEFPFENGATNKDYNTLYSINDFRYPQVYDDETRELLTAYIENCAGIVATSLKRYQLYTKKYEWGLSYFTDGQIIFNNFLFEYIKHDDFAIPSKWFAIIARKNFIPEKFELDFDLMTGGGLDVFLTMDQTFNDYAEIRKAISK